MKNIYFRSGYFFNCGNLVCDMLTFRKFRKSSLHLVKLRQSFINCLIFMNSRSLTYSTVDSLRTLRTLRTLTLYLLTLFNELLLICVN